jgi:hypothetical protein
VLSFREINTAYVIFFFLDLLEFKEILPQVLNGPAVWVSLVGKLFLPLAFATTGSLCLMRQSNMQFALTVPLAEDPTDFSPPPFFPAPLGAWLCHPAPSTHLPTHA